MQEKYDGTYEGLRLYAGGVGVVGHAITKKISDDLKIAELISIPLTFILLVLVFGALAASAMPLIVGVAAILGAFFILYLFTLFTTVSIYALNLTTGMGLGLGIDYALLMVNRFREELHRGKSVEDSIVTTMATAGKDRLLFRNDCIGDFVISYFLPATFLTVIWICRCICSCTGSYRLLYLVCRQLWRYLAIASIRELFANLQLLRRKMVVGQKLRLVMKRPVSAVVLSMVILGIMAAPITNIKFSQGDSRMLPADNKAAFATALQAERFSRTNWYPN